MRTCFTGYCDTDADCTAHPCGWCAPITGPCCDFLIDIGCVYLGGCTRNTECPEGELCTLDSNTGTGMCTSKPGACPI